MISAAPTTAFGRKHILVIDDESRLAESLAALLRGAGYQVKPATSGPIGLDAVQKEEFDLVITDLRMDSVDGFDIMRHLAERCPNTQIIVITGHASTESAIEAIHRRVCDYIPKPFDLEVLRRSIEKAFAQQDADRMRRDLIDMLTHDIKVPLTNILGFAQLITDADGRPAADTAEYAQIIISNCVKALALLENYLTNARVEEGRLETLLTPVNLHSIIEDELRLMSLEIQKKGILIEKLLGELPETLHADQPLLARAISNLLSNAAKYTPRGGRVRIVVEHGGGEVHVTISNTGTGLAAHEQEDIFKRYRRASTSRGVGGAGLGLHVVRCVAEAHGGHVSCQGSADEIHFKLTLPYRSALT